MRSGARQAMAHRGRCLPHAPRMLGLLAIITIISAFTLAGCYLSRPVDEATASDVNNRSFAFANGAAFHAALANVSTTLSFTDNAANFTLSSSGGMATGTHRFDSCILTVTTSTYSATAGPQMGNVITLDPCEFNSDNNTLTVENMGITTTSMAATPVGTGGGNVHQATPSDVNNRRFTFANGGVFHSNLVNVQTALAFTNTATMFELSSTGGTAMGTHRFGSCILTVTDSTYPNASAGPQEDDVITLNPCNFDSNNNTLTVSNRGIMVISAAGTL